MLTLTSNMSAFSLDDTIPIRFGITFSSQHIPCSPLLLGLVIYILIIPTFQGKSVFLFL